jgi:hypothetical protein
MKKFTLLVVVLLCFGLVGAFGQMLVEPTIEVEASSTFGGQLDEMVAGIDNDASATLAFTIYEESTEEFGEGDVYGWIELEDFEIDFDAENDGDGSDVLVDDAVTINPGEITAKVIFGNAYINITSADDDVDQAGDVTEVEYDLISIEDSIFGVDPNVLNEPNTEFAGVAFGMEMEDLVAFELGLASEFDWDIGGTGANVDDAYVLSIMADIMALPDVGIELYSNMWIGRNPVTGDDFDGAPGDPYNPAAVGILVDYTMPLTGDINLVPKLGFDYVTKQDFDEDQTSRMEVAAGANLLWPGLGLDDEDEDIFVGEDQEVTSGVGVGVRYGIHDFDFLSPGAGSDEKVNTLEVKAALWEDSGDDGLLPIVGAILLVNYNSVSENSDLGLDAYSEMALGLEVSADLDVVSPFFGLLYGSYDLAGNYDATYDGDTKQDLALNVGVDVMVIPNTTFTLEYASGDLSNDDLDDYTWGDTYGDEPLFNDGATTSAAKLGTLTLTTEVSF